MVPEVCGTYNGEGDGDAFTFMPGLCGFQGSSSWPLCNTGCKTRRTFLGLIQQGCSYDSQGVMLKRKCLRNRGSQTRKESAGYMKLSREGR